MSSSVLGHGVFIYDAALAIARYGSPDLVAQAIVECDMQHAWVRVHGATKTHDPMPTLPLIEALKSHGVSVAGWGWCQGSQIEAEVELAITAVRQFEIEDYVADIEDGVHNASWTPAEVRTFLGSVREELPNSQIGVSSFAFIPWHKPELMRAAEEFVDFFAPQIYWFNFPTKKIITSVDALISEFPLNDPVAYTRLCIREWQKVVKKPLVLTGQAYWGEVADFLQSNAEAKMKVFLTGFDDWSHLQGFNWWHLGGKGQDAMSFDMFQTLKSSELNSRFRGSDLPTSNLGAPSESIVKLDEPKQKIVSVNIKEYALESARSRSCSTEGVTGLSQQIFELLKRSIGDGILVSCEEVVEIVGQSTIPYLQVAAKNALKRAADEMGQRPRLVHAYRTIAQQYVLYHWFKTGHCNITLAASPGSSPHEQGIAIDIENNARWRNVLSNYGWKWRGPSDPGHFTYIGSGSNSQIRTEGILAFQRLWNRNNPNDLIDEDGIYGDLETGPRLLKSPVEGFRDLDQ